MENLQIKAGDVFKLVVLCCSAVAYYFYLNKSIGILNERLKALKKNCECLFDKNREDHLRMFDKLDEKVDK
jgi:hypothetical protein